MCKTEHLSILFFGTQIATGGAQKSLLDQANWFQARGHKVTVAFFYDKENLHRKWQEGASYPIHVITSYQKWLGEWRSALELFKGLWKLWKLLHHGNFDVIVSFTHDSNILALPLAWMTGIPLRIATHHGLTNNYPCWRERLHTWIVNHGVANILVAVSARTRQSALREGIQAKRIVVIKNGIQPLPIETVNKPEARKAAGLQDGDIFLVSVGRLVYEKAHEILVSAMPLILQRHPNVRLGILGDGLLRPQLEAQIAEMKLAQSIRLFGMSDAVTQHLAVADIFILPSRSEGLPIALLEAMSAGLPVVVTNLDGMDDLIKHGQHGLLVPVENPRALADAILQLLSDMPATRQMGLASRSLVMENYTEEKMCEQYLSLMKRYFETSRIE
jgi:glycosyltransferase involved in cell wall biosynthesis